MTVSAPAGVVSPLPNPAPVSPGQVWANQAASAVSPASQGAIPAPAPVVAGAGIPSYAVPIAGQQNSDLKASMSLVLGIVGLVGGLFIPLIGLVLGTTGIVFSTMARRTTKHKLSTAGLILSILAIVGSLAVWVYAVSHDPRFSHNAANSSSGATKSVTTPCYSVKLPKALNVQNDNGSCNLEAYNGTTLDSSSDAYKVLGTVSAVSASSFTDLAKQAIESDVQQSLPGFTVSNEVSGTFTGSPAYFVTANKTGVSVIEAAVLHTATNGDNFFVFVHAVNGSSVDLSALQAGWQWR